MRLSLQSANAHKTDVYYSEIPISHCTWGSKFWGSNHEALIAKCKSAQNWRLLERNTGFGLINRCQLHIMIILKLCVWRLFLSFCFRSTSSGSSINSPGASIGAGACTMNGSYPVMGQFGSGQYCPVSENLGLTPHYSSGWYQSSAADPRFASKWLLSNFIILGI